jgi:hypothetical protein
MHRNKTEIINVMRLERHSHISIPRDAPVYQLDTRGKNWRTEHRSNFSQEEKMKKSTRLARLGIKT